MTLDQPGLASSLLLAKLNGPGKPIANPEVSAWRRSPMYGANTETFSTVQPVDAVTSGRILVVDDDRPFGGFMVAALETRGHTVDWAGCVGDALATLYACRYDLVMIDLRLPDGSGFDLLREATDAGLLAQSSTIILTGHDFEEPGDIRVFRKSMALDALLDRMGDLVAITRRRRPAVGRPPAAHRGTAHDGRRLPKAAKIELVLYISPSSEKCQKAIRSIRNVLEKYDGRQVNFKICDMSGRLEDGDGDAVIFTPTLVKRAPGPRTWIVGNLDQPELLTDLLDVSGVERKRDGR
jgi:CheY-like chemotaxis protein